MSNCIPSWVLPDSGDSASGLRDERLFDAGGNLLAASSAAGTGTGCALDILYRRGAGGDSGEDVVSGRPHAGADELG